MKVLVLPNTETAAALTGRLLEWSAAELLQRFCVATAADPVDAPVRRIEAGVTETMTLGRALAEAPPGEIAFLAFLPVGPGEEAPAGFSEWLDRFYGWVHEDVLDADEENLLARGLAVAPAAGEQRIPRGLFRAKWTNLLVAPEDRAGPGEVSQLQGEDGAGAERYLRHAAHAAASLASLWASPEAQRADLLEEVGRRRGNLQVAVRVVRCFSRVVELGHLPDHVAAAVFEPRGGWPRPGTGFERPPDPERLVGAVAGAYLKRNRATLLGRPFEPIREEPPEKLSLWEALKVLWRQILDYVKRRPFELIEEAVAEIHERAARRIEALSVPTGRIRVRSWGERPEDERGLAQLGELLDEETLVTEDGHVATTWAELRRTALGLIDGSDLPDGVARVATGAGDRPLLVSEPRFVAADPEVEEELPIEPLLQRVRAAVAAAREAAEARAKALAQPERADEQESEAEEEEEKKPRRFRLLRSGGWVFMLLRRVVGYSLLALLGLLVAFIGLPFLTALAVGAAILALLGIALALLARNALRLPRLPEDPEAERELIELNRLLERALALGDARRLTRRLEELDEWIAILAELAHRPWVREPFERIELVRTADEGSLPAACSVSVALSDEQVLERLGSRARAQTFRTGWLMGVYHAVADPAMEEFVLAHGDVGPPPDPDADVSSDPDSPRRFLLAAVRRGEGRRRRDNPMAGDLLEAIDVTPLDLLAPEVVPASAAVRPLPPTATWLAPPADIAPIVGENGARVLGIRGWSATATVIAPGLAVTAPSAVDGVLGAIGVDGAQVPVSATSVANGHGVGVLRFDEELGLEPCLGPAPNPPRNGEPVVAVEATADGAGGRWGYAIADGERLTAIYDGGAPAIGAAVLGLAGELFGVQGERGEIVPVPPVAELIEALEGDGEAAANGAGRAPEPISASHFLAAVAEEKGAATLVARYWTGHSDANEVERALPAGLSQEQLAGPVAELSGGASYLRPLRVTVHRIEVTRPVEPDALAACE